MNLLIQSDFPIALPSLTKTLPNEPDRTQQNHIYPVAFFFFLKAPAFFLSQLQNFLNLYSHLKFSFESWGIPLQLLNAHPPAFSQTDVNYIPSYFPTLLEETDE